MTVGAARAPRLALASLLAFPLLLAAADAALWYSPLARDAWLYYGYFQNGIDALRRYPDLYYGSRLSVILPGFATHHLLPPEAANAVLRIALFTAVLGGYWSVARRCFGARAALLGGIALASYPYFVRSAGWNYVDGFGIAYFACAAAGVERWRRSGRPAWLALAGMLAAAMVTANVVYALLGAWLVARALRPRAGTAAGARTCAWLGAGGVVGLAAFAASSKAVAGHWNYLAPSFAFGTRFVTGRQANVWRLPADAWLPHAFHLVLPAAVVAGLVLGWTAWNRYQEARWFGRAFLIGTALLVALQMLGANVLQMSWGASPLLLPMAWALAATCAPIVESLRRRQYLLLAGGLAGAAVLVYALARVRVLERASWTAALAGAALVALGIAAGGRRVRAAPFLWIAGLTLVTAAVLPFVRRPLGGIASGRAAYLQVVRLFDAIDRHDPWHTARVWYDVRGNGAAVFDAVGSSLLLCPRAVSLDFPSLHGGQLCDGARLAPGLVIALLTTRTDGARLASAAMAPLGMAVDVEREDFVPGPVANARVILLRVRAAS